MNIIARKIKELKPDKQIFLHARSLVPVRKSKTQEDLESQEQLQSKVCLHSGKSTEPLHWK